MHSDRRRKGFTLLEMIAVVVVIGVLAAAIVPSLKSSREDAKSARAQSDLQAIRAGIESYVANHSAFPTLTNLIDEPLADRVVNQVGPDPYSPTNANYQLVTSGSYPDTVYAVISIGLNTTADVTASDLSDGTLTSDEAVDDVYATNAKRP